MNEEYYRKNKVSILVQQRGYYRKNREKIIERNKAYQKRNQKKIKEQRRLRYLRNKEKSIQEACERNLIYSIIERNCCVICFEINPFVLERHHPFKNNNFKVTLCANCHQLIHFCKKKRTPNILNFFMMGGLF